MNMFLASFTVIVPQLSSWSHSDIINAVIASVAVLTLITTTFANRKSNQAAVRGVNREERLKLYAPVIALLQGTWIKVDTEILQMRDPTFRPPISVNEAEMEELQSRIRNFEYGVFESILGSTRLRQTIDKLMENLNVCINHLRKVIIEDDLLAKGQPSTIPEYAEKRPEFLVDLSRRSSQIKEDLEQLLSFAREELAP